MNYSFIIKMIFISFFIFILLYALNFSSTQKDLVSSNNFGVKNTTKEALNIGDLRVSGAITYNDTILLNSTIENYIQNNNINVDDVRLGIAVNDNIVTVRINTSKNLFDEISNSSATFSYKVERSS